MTTNTRRTLSLGHVLWADALLTGGFALVLAVAAAPLAGLFALPEPLIRWAGIGLLPFAAFVALVARLAARPVPPRAGVRTVIACNALWTVASVVLLFTGWVDPNPLGVAFVVAQALLVGAIAELQYLGLRRA
ncbi:hypothetical protein [Streptosporangium sp. NPDC048865]|uniref:hypothetical protein n=1 Tax=Streptosporangium sp. NPDC048865 TaxID=3155766 RepID=UPI00343F52F6